MAFHGHLIDGRLSGEAVSLVIKERVATIGLAPEEYSGHSLRAGLATSAASAGSRHGKSGRRQATPPTTPTPTS